MVSKGLGYMDRERGKSNSRFELHANFKPNALLGHRAMNNIDLSNVHVL